MICTRSSNPEYTRHVERYLKLINWARRRWGSPDGSIALSVRGVPTLYARLEAAAFERFTQATQWTEQR